MPPKVPVVVKTPAPRATPRPLPMLWTPRDLLVRVTVGHESCTVVALWPAEGERVVLDCSCGQIVEVDHDASMALGATIAEIRKRLERFVAKAVVQ